MNYGHHQARSADALSWLLTHAPEFPREELPVVLSCRRALLAAHRERCERAVRGADVYSAVFERRGYNRDLTALARGGAMALRHLLDQYPSFDEHAIRFTDALEADAQSPYAQAWTEAARHAVLATEVVVSRSDWTEQPGQAWQVVADVSDAAEALVAIDRKLARARAELHDAPTALRRPSAELRLVARHMASVARAGEFDPAVDGIHRQEPHRGPISIRHPGDLVLGARATERLLRDSDLSIRELRTFALIQADIAHTCAELLADSPLAALRDSFRRRDEQYRDLAGATARVASIGPSSGSAVLAQSQEVGRFLLEVRRSGRPAAPAGLISDFDAEQPQLANTLAINIRRHLAAGHYLVVDDGEVSLRWRRTEAGERAALQRAAENVSDRFVRSAGAAVDFAAQRLAVRERDARTVTPPSVAERAREQLRLTLDREPYGRRPLTPNRLPSSRL